MMTGLYPSKTRVMGNIGAAGGNPLRQETIGKMLQGAGYDTAYFGKWHLGNDPKGTAGWDEAFFKQKDPEAARKSVEYVRSRANRDRTNRDRPFAMVTSFLDPHDIYHFTPDRFRPPDPGTSLPPSWEREDFATKPKVHREFMERDQGTRLHGRSRETWEAYHEFYRDKVRKVDGFIGGVLDAIKAAGLWDNTIIVIASDHGDMDAHHRLIFKGPFMYDQMIRIPFLVRVPDRFGGTGRGRAVEDYDVVNVDLVPTIRDFAGVDAIPTDGISLRPFLTGASNPPRRDFVISQYYSKQTWVNPIRTIRTAKFKYNRYIDHGEELYDLKNDPHEIVNRAADASLAGTKKALRADLDRWIAANDDPFYSLKTTPLVRKRRRRS